MKRLLILPLLALAACKDDPEQIPVYLHIEPFIVNAEGGAAWQEITEGWIYVNGEFLGAYHLPANAPILAEGDSEILVYPGVKENGITSTPNIYPFLTRYSVQKDLVAGQTVAIQPQTSYDNATVFPWALNRTSFDGGSAIALENRDSDPDNTFKISTNGAFSGNSVRLEVDTAHSLMQVATEAVALPATYENPVWLELNYACDIPFTMYLIGQSGGQNEIEQPLYAFSSTDGQWNKIYINLADFLISLNQEEYRLYFYVSLPRNDQNQFTQNTGVVRLDNIRLTHF